MIGGNGKGARPLGSNENDSAKVGGNSMENGTSDKDLEAMAKQAEEERAMLQLAKVLWGSIIKAELPREIMEGIGRAVVDATERQSKPDAAWEKLGLKAKVGIMRVAVLLQMQLPRTAEAVAVKDAELLEGSARQRARYEDSAKPPAEPPPPSEE